MFRNKRRNSFDNQLCSSQAPIVVSSLAPLPPAAPPHNHAHYDQQYQKLKKEFYSTTQIRQNTATLTENYSPAKRRSHSNLKKKPRKPIVFQPYEEQKQCLYVRPKGLLQVDPKRFQITPSELTMLRGTHYVALTQVDVSTATGEVKRLEVPPSSPIHETGMKNTSFSINVPQSTSTLDPIDVNDNLSTCSSAQSLTLKSPPGRSRKGYFIPLPHGNVYNKTT